MLKCVKRLISLEEHNEIIRQSAHDPFCNESMPNGVACPDCGDELYDTMPNMMLSMMPPKKHVHCRKCGYRGGRLA